ncbi:XRE family transcriptional regulator [Lachnospiraceae bacterium]|nr:XRE family transcriptional regulator [Lachnospiraceae bacterium]
MGLGMNLKKILKDKNLTIKDLSEKSGVSLHTLYSITKRDNNMSRYDIVEKIACTLDVTVKDLTGFEVYEMESTDYDHSYSYASSEEDFNKNQIELANKKDGNTHKYDASIPIEVTPERIGRNRIQNKLLAGEHVTPEELEVLNSYYSSEQFRNSYKKLKEVAQEGLATIERLKTAYSKLNDIGQEKVAEHAEMIAKIPEYQKDPDEPQED